MKSAIAALSAGCGFIAGVAAAAALYGTREHPYRPPLEEDLQAGAEYGIAVAKRSEALTFARFRRDGRLRLILVDSYARGVLHGMEPGREEDAAQDPIALFQAFGYEGIEKLVGIPVRVEESELTVPFEGTDRQIASGGNYPKHAAETSIPENFLFPKIAVPGRFTADVPVERALLDHEVELGFVMLAPLRRGSPLKHVGLVLASDYTDRAALLRGLDLKHITSGRGFPEAKSRPGFMPVGNLFVIPKDAAAFVRSLKLRLYVNGRLHQEASPSRMLWDIERMTRQVFREEGRTWDCAGRAVMLSVNDGQLAARTVILSGTADGVLFRKPSVRQLTLGMLEAAGGGFRNARNKLVERAIREAREQRRYLQPGMTVVMRAERLGIIRNLIVAGAE